MKKISTILLVTVFSLFIFSGLILADSGGEDGGMITFSINSDPKVLNPMYGSDRVTMTINNAIYDPLLMIVDGQRQYFLAESLKQKDDYKTYILKLKKNLKWHDGEAITAEDIVFTFEQILDKEQHIHLRDYFVFDGKEMEVTKIDRRTVKFELPQISMAFVSSLVNVYPIPEHIYRGVEDLQKTNKNNHPVGSGPFKFADMRSGENVILSQFSDYYKGAPHLNKVVYRVIADTNSANIALKTAELSAKYVNPGDVKKFKGQKKYEVITFKENMLDYLVFNLNSRKLKDKKVRQAIAYAIDKKQLINGSYRSIEYADPAYSIFTTNTKFHTTNLKKYGYNLAKAKTLLKEVGKDNLELKLAYVNSDKTGKTMGLIIQQQLSQLGINIQLMALDRGAFYNKLLDPENESFDLCFNGYVMGSEPDAYKSLFMAGQKYNFMNYNNPELDKLWKRGVVTTDRSKRAALYKKIQRQIIEDMVEYPIAYPKSIVVINSKYGGLEEAQPAPIFMFRDLSKLYIKN